MAAVGGAGTGVGNSAETRVIPYSRIVGALATGERVGGSTGALKIKYNGKSYIYKAGRAGHVVNEYIAFQLYAAAGARVPAVYLVINEEVDNIPQAVLIDYLDGITVADALSKHIFKFGQKFTLFGYLKSEFVFHALFANWDAKNSENHMILKESDGETYNLNEPYSIDLGGALFYRAMGELKPTRLFSGFAIPELDAIPAESAETTSKIYVIPDREDLRNPTLLRAIVCARWPTVNQERILETISQLEPLLMYIPHGNELENIIASRMLLMNDFCRKGVMRKSLNAAIGKIEGQSTIIANMTPGLLKGNAIRNVAAMAHKNITESLESNAYTPFRMRGARALAEPPPPLREENRSLITIRERAPTERVSYVGYNNINDDDISSEISELGDIPNPGIMVAPNRTPNAERIRHTILAARKDPAIDEWMKAQVAFLESGLTLREQNLLISYTRHGDRLLNNYLRRTLREDIRDLMTEIINSPADDPLPLAYSIMDQFGVLLRTHRLVLPLGWTGRPSELLDTSGELDMERIREFILANQRFFFSARNILTLIEQYYRDLIAIFTKAPKPPHNFTVFRGVLGDTYLGSLQFKTSDFLSTSITPDIVVEKFTKRITDESGLLERAYHCCVYELEVRRDVPCIYLEILTQYPGEFEVLLAPGIIVDTDPMVRMKYYTQKPGAFGDIVRGVASSRGGTWVSVVEGTVSLPSDKQLDIKVGSLGELPRAERFEAVKPRGLQPGKGRKKRIAWKTERNRKRGGGRTRRYKKRN